MIYLDYAATTPFLPENIKLYSELTADYFYNHESLHAGGDEVKSLREAAEHYLDDMFTDNLTTIVTTSASEANRIAIELYLYGKHQPRVLVSPLGTPLYLLSTRTASGRACSAAYRRLRQVQPQHVRRQRPNAR